MTLTNVEKILLVEDAKQKLNEAVELLEQADLDAHAHAYLIDQLRQKVDGYGNQYEFNCDKLVEQLIEEDERYCQLCGASSTNTDTLLGKVEAHPELGDLGPYLVCQHCN
jgi:hypothetical protein